MPTNKPAASFPPEAVFTIGHSTRELSALIELLQASHVQCLVDVRTVPRSRTNPQFNGDTLPAALQANGIDYEHLTALGGLRGKSRTVVSDVNGFWNNDSFHHYADYALSDEFQQGLATLIDLTQQARCAIMCAEAVWWRCHRRIISDYLIARGIPVFHIMGPERVDAASLTSGAAPQQDGTVHYPQPSDSHEKA